MGCIQTALAARSDDKALMRHQEELMQLSQQTQDELNALELQRRGLVYKMEEVCKKLNVNSKTKLTKDHPLWPLLLELKHCQNRTRRAYQRLSNEVNMKEAITTILGTRSQTTYARIAQDLRARNINVATVEEQTEEAQRGVDDVMGLQNATGTIDSMEGIDLEPLFRSLLSGELSQQTQLTNPHERLATAVAVNTAPSAAAASEVSLSGLRNDQPLLADPHHDSDRPPNDGRGSAGGLALLATFPPERRTAPQPTLELAAVLGN